MNLKRMVCASTLAAGVATAGLFGVGLGTAGADPGHHAADRMLGSARTTGPRTTTGTTTDPHPWTGSTAAVDQGRQDHQPFMWNGQRVDPLPAGNGDGWGFWFLGQWIRL